MLNIGICDDYQCFCELTDMYLRQYAEEKKCEFNIWQFGSGEELLSWLDKENIRLDILFLDYHMKVLTGLETARIIRKRKSNCRIVFVSSMDNPYELLEVQPLTIIPKPLTQKVLDRILDGIGIENF